MAHLTSLPTISEYDLQVQTNNQQMAVIFQAMFPDLDRSLVYQVAQITSYLYETHVNADIIPRVIRGIHNVTIGTGRGEVVIHIQQGKSNVEVRENDDKLETKLI